jgi:hypothetical protein
MRRERQEEDGIYCNVDHSLSDCGRMHLPLAVCGYAEVKCRQPSAACVVVLSSRCCQERQAAPVLCLSSARLW